MTLHKWAAIALVMCLAATPAGAQGSTGTILGVVTDASGAAVPGALVTATNLDTQFTRSVPTDASGQYALPLMPIGKYKVDVALDGFKNFSQTGIVLEVGRNARIDAKIEPGNVSEVVSVTADAPLIETTTASLSRAVSQNEVLNLPLVNRDLYQLLSITGGVTSNDASNSLGGPEQTTTINGSQKAQIGTVNFQLDGGNNTAGLRGTGNPAPNPEAVQEFRVITSNFSAEYGRYPAGIVDVVTKSGTNQWRGAAFEFFRDEVLEREALGAARRDRHQGSARSQSVRRRRLAVRSCGTRRFSSPAIRDCGKRRRITGIPPSCRPRSSATATSRNRRSARMIRRRASRFPAASFRRRDSTPRPGPSRIVSSRNRTCPTASLKSARPIRSRPTKSPSSSIIN